MAALRRKAGPDYGGPLTPPPSGEWRPLEKNPQLTSKLVRQKHGLSKN